MEINKQLRESLAHTIRTYHVKGWSPATSTNYSFRENATAQEMYVSRSGIDKSAFLPEDFMAVDFAGKPTPEYAEIRPSAETLIHGVLYEMFPEATVILHSHSVYAVLMSQKHDAEITFQGYEIQKGFDGQTTHEATVSIPVFDNSQDMVEFTARMQAGKAALGNHSFVIRNHGTYAWGRNLFEAKRHLETLEYLLEVAFKSQL
jgi:methylthioribulose-1-phosphate dehydratase